MSTLEEIEVKEKQEAIQTAETLMSEVRYVRGERPGYITTSRMRRMLDLVSKARIYGEFKIRFLYHVSRNSDRNVKDLENFANALLEEVKKKEAEKQLSFTKSVLEYATMIYYAKEVQP